MFDIEFPAKPAIEIPAVIHSSSGKFEEVADISGLVIPAMFQSKYNDGKNSLLSFIDAEAPYKRFLSNHVN